MKKLVVSAGISAVIAGSSLSAASTAPSMYRTLPAAAGQNTSVEPQVVPAAAAAVGVQLVRAAAAAGVFTVFSEGIKNLSEAYKNFSKGSAQLEIQSILPETALD